MYEPKYVRDEWNLRGGRRGRVALWLLRGTVADRHAPRRGRGAPVRHHRHRGSSPIAVPRRRRCTPASRASPCMEHCHRNLLVCCVCLCWASGTEGRASRQPRPGPRLAHAVREPSRSQGHATRHRACVPWRAAGTVLGLHRGVHVAAAAVRHGPQMDPSAVLLPRACAARRCMSQSTCTSSATCGAGVVGMGALPFSTCAADVVGT